MKNRIVVATAAAVAALVLIAGGIYVYFFSGLRTSPSQLALSATQAASGSRATASTGLAGTWNVATGSLAGYRVQELFVGQTSQHEAVARTSSVSGRLTVTGDSSGYQASAITLTVGLSGLHSVDQVAGRDVSQRDSVVARQLDLQQNPDAVFTAPSATVPGSISAQPVDVSVAGKVTIHGVTKDVTATAKAQLVGDRVEIAGRVSLDMSDFGVSPPAAPFVTVDSKVILEFDIFLAKA